jgi:hypothetical protein
MNFIKGCMNILLQIYIYIYIIDCIYRKELFRVICRLAIIRATTSTLLTKKKTFSIDLLRQLFLVVLNRHEQDCQNS